MYQREKPVAFVWKSMSISLVVGGFGSGAMGNQGVVSLRGSFAHCVATEVRKVGQGVVVGRVLGTEFP